MVRVTKTNTFTPQVDGYFVPDAKMKQILDRLSEKEVYGN